MFMIVFSVSKFIFMYQVMVSSLEITVIIVLIFLIVGLIYLNIKYYNLIKTARQSLYRSFIIPEGKSETLKAPDGYTMAIDKLYVGVGPTPGSDSTQASTCYTSLQDLIDSSSGLPCKLPTIVYCKNRGITLSETIPQKIQGQSTATVSADDVDQTITDSGRDEGCVSNADNCTFYVFGICEYVPE